MASRAVTISPTKSEETGIASEMSNETVQPAVSENVNVNEVAALAYQYWQERNCPIGSDQEDWFRAEETLKSRTRSTSAAA